MDIATINIIKDLISTLGFPIFVALYLLFRTEKILKQLSDNIKLLDELIVTLIAKIDAKNV